MAALDPPESVASFERGIVQWSCVMRAVIFTKHGGVVYRELDPGLSIKQGRELAKAWMAERANLIPHHPARALLLRTDRGQELVFGTAPEGLIEQMH